MFKFSVKEKILIYLEDNTEEQLHLKGVPPIFLSQTVMADSIGLPLKDISKEIKSLQKEGLIERKRFCVRETGRFRNFYFLTSGGIMKAKELQEEINKTKIKVREKDKTMEIKILDLIQYLKKKNKKSVEINYTNVIRNITQNGFLDVKTILEPKKYIDYPEKRPEIKYFVGREKELNEIKNFLKSKSNILCIRGIAGIGKTTLLSKFVENLEMNIFWHRFTEFSTLRGLLTKISGFLSKMDRRKLENYLKGERFEVEEILILLEEELKGSNALFIFDDFQKADKELIDFFRSFKDLETDVKIIIMGRIIPLFYDRREIVIKKNIREIVLVGLDKEDSIKLLKYRKIEKDLDKIYQTTKGHPLLLELVTSETASEAEEYIKEEIIRGLKDKEKKTLEMASVFRYPFPGKAIIDGADYDTMDGLVDKLLMQRSGDVYDLHDVIREFIYNRLNEKQKIKYHELVSEYYEKELGEGALIETIYHLLQAEKQGKAAALIVEKGEHLVEKGFSKELNKLIKQISKNQLSIASWAEILKVKSTLDKFLGEWDNAITEAQECINISKELGNRKLQGECCSKIGEILISKAEYDYAREKLQEALQIFEKINDQREIAETYLWLGKASLRTGKIEDALERLEKGLKISEKIGNERLQAMTWNDIGAVHHFKGEYEKALEMRMKSLKYFERTGDKYEIGRAQNNIGVAYWMMSDYRKAVEWYEKSMKTNNDAGIIRGVGYNLLGIAECYARLGENLEKAGRYTNEALEIFRKLDERRMIGACHDSYGLIYHKKKEWDRASEHFEKAIKIGREIKALDSLSYLHHEYGRMLIDKGDKDKAREQFQKSIDFYEKLGNKKKVEEVKKKLAELNAMV